MALTSSRLRGHGASLVCFTWEDTQRLFTFTGNLARDRELCRELDLIHCVDPIKHAPVHGRIRYFRLHGPKGYRSRYKARDLQQVYETCWGETYCFFNNVSMFEDARDFCAYLKKKASCEERF